MIKIITTSEGDSIVVSNRKPYSDPAELTIEHGEEKFPFIMAAPRYIKSKIAREEIEIDKWYGEGIIKDFVDKRHNEEQQKIQDKLEASKSKPASIEKPEVVSEEVITPPASVDINWPKILIPLVEALENILTAIKPLYEVQLAELEKEIIIEPAISEKSIALEEAVLEELVEEIKAAETKEPVSESNPKALYAKPAEETSIDGEGLLAKAVVTKPDKPKRVSRKK